MNLTYDPDDFAFTVVLSINNRVLYKNTLSGEYLSQGFQMRLCGGKINKKKYVPLYQT
jgi:hypothetical protein